ncbi:TPA: GGDEF domain-containing protein, partial [Vibrio vulnificus]
MASKNYINVSRRAVYLALITFLCLNLTSVTPFFYVEHPIDVLTESAYFSVLVYIRAAISRSITSTRSITVGVNLILFVALYDVLTEVDW